MLPTLGLLALVSWLPIQADVRLESLLTDNLNDAQAWEIEVKGHYLIGKDYGGGAFAFSPDAKLIAYPTRNRDRYAIAIKSTAPPHERVHLIETGQPDPYVLALTWSPDGSRVAYTANSGLNVMDIGSGKNLSLAITGGTDFRSGTLVWPDEQHIRHVRIGFDDDLLINLDDLTAKAIPKRIQDEGAHAHAKLTTPYDMKNGYRFASKSPRQKQTFVSGDPLDTNVLLVSKDGAFARRLDLDLREREWCHTQDLRFIAQANGFYDKDRFRDLTLHVVGVRLSPQRQFTTHIVIPEKMSINLKKWKNDREYFERAVQAKLFYADVYPPKTNPLNGKVIGPDYDKQLAVVRFATMKEGMCKAQITYEIDDYSSHLAPGGPGLVIGPPYAQLPGNSISFPKGTWFPLLLDNAK